jgi:hypothetical protein
MIDLDEWRGRLTNLDELLKIAGAPNNARTRASLELNLLLARGQCELLKERRQVPATLFKQLDRRITQTMTLLQELERYPAWRDVCFQTYVSGDGIAIATSPKEIFEGKLTLPRKLPPRPKRPKIGSNDTAITVNVRAALGDIHGIVRPTLRRTRGQPKKDDKFVCVLCAEKFFDNYSRHKASTDPNNPFSAFCERFYDTVSGGTSEAGALAWHIRKTLAKKRS